MSRNKHPEQTEQLILDTAERLFVEKGYESTSIQNIIDELGGLTKGAIYHHFKSKEEILLAIGSRIDKEKNAYLISLRNSREMNAAEKLKKMFEISITDSDNANFFKAAPIFMKNPHLLIHQIENIFTKIVPEFMEPVMKEGLQDGSIQTEYPKEIAEVVILLSNIWLNPLVTAAAKDEIIKKCEFYQSLLKMLGLDIIDDAMIQKLKLMFDQYYESNPDTGK